MKTILTYQKSSKNSNDIIVIDSVVSEYNGNEEQRFAMGILNSTEKKKDYSMFKIITQGCSPSLTIEKGEESGGVWISSHFLSRDDSGRNIPYSFWMCSFNSSIEIISKLEESAQLSKMELNPTDLTAIERCINIFPKVKYAVIAIGIILVLIILKIVL